MADKVDDKTYMKQVQQRIIKDGGSLDDYVKGMQEIDYEQNTGKNDGSTSMFKGDELERLGAIRAKQKAILKKQIKDKELDKATTTKQTKFKGGATTKNRIGGNDYRKGGYVLSTVDNRKKMSK